MQRHTLVILLIVLSTFTAESNSLAQQKPDTRHVIVLEQPPHVLPMPRPRATFILQRLDIPMTDVVEDCNRTPQDLFCQGVDHQRKLEDVLDTLTQRVLERHARAREAEEIFENLQQFRDGLDEWRELRGEPGDALGQHGSESSLVGLLVDAERDLNRTLLAMELRNLETMIRDERAKAIAHFTSFLPTTTTTNDPRRADALYRLAILHVQKTEDAYVEAIERYEVALNRFDEGDMDMELPEPELDYGVAVGILRQLVAEYPNFGHRDGALYLLGYCLLDMGSDDGVEMYLKLVHTHPGSPLAAETWMRLGEHYFDMDQLDDAEAAYRKVATPDRHLTELAQYKLAWTLYRKDALAAALASFRALLTADGRSGVRDEALTYTAIILCERDWDLDGIDDETSVMKRIDAHVPSGTPWAHEVLVRIGELLFDATLYEDAIEVYRRVLSDHPTHPDAPEYRHRIIQTYERLRLLDEANQERARFMADFGPGSVWREARGGELGAIAVADALLERVMLENALHHHTRAQHLAHSGHPDSAKQSYTHAIEAYRAVLVHVPDPTGDHHVFLADCLLHVGNAFEATKVLDVVADRSASTRRPAVELERAAWTALAEAVEAGAAPPGVTPGMVRKRLEQVDKRLDALGGPTQDAPPLLPRHPPMIIEGEGIVDPSQVKRIVRQRSGEIVRCAEAERGEPNGRLRVRFDIGLSGQVTAVEVLENATGVDAIAACVASRLKGWRFPRPDGGLVSVSWTFV
ncbi:MAG: tetratricopeptide repeat protein, partial [Myxococcota bacterium]